MRVYKAKKCSQCGKIFIPTGNRQILCKDCKEKKPDKQRKCKACGKMFSYIRGDKIFCGAKCAKDFTDYDENSTVENVYITEENRNKPPTIEYIKETNYLLKDFGIDIEIPHFNTVAEVDVWRKNMIKLYL